jgi:type II secretory ATPase GspE/PulE/Tfp pilus assembly ATPase PilB-like protein
VERGYKTLRMDGVDKILNRVTTVDEVLKVTQTDIF